MDIRMRKASTVMRALIFGCHETKIVNKSNTLAKFFQTVPVPILIYDHQCCGLIKKIRSKMQTSELL